MALGSLNEIKVNSTSLNSGSTGFAPIVPDVADICLGEFNAAPVNSYEVNGCRFLASLGVQNILSLAQLVGIEVVGTAVTFQQAVELIVSISGSVVTYNQQVKKTLSADTAVTFTQLTDEPGSFLDIHGWDAYISINGVEIPKTALIDNINISKESNGNTLCDFKVKVALPLDFIDYIDGGAVVINYFDTTGGHRLFTGTVDSPEIDIINKWITIRCSDRREELIKDKMLTLLPTLGRYSRTVQGEITSVANEMAYRLQTVAADVDFDSYNTPNINSWYAKASADYAYTNSDVYYQEPRITWQSRGSIVNDITVEVKYKYPRLYHYQRPFTWTTTSPEAVLISGDHEDGFSFPTVSMIRGAIEGANWRDNGTLTYTESLSNYWIVPTNLPNSTGGTTLTPVIYHLQSVDDYEVTTASWDGSTRFAQTVEETYTLNVNSTQSISQYTSLSAFANYSVEADYDTNGWEDYKLQTPQEEGAVVSNDSYYVDKDINRDERNQCILTAIDKAKVQIISGHRDTVVSLQVPIKPDLELRHTLEIDTTPIACKGKVVRLQHIINIKERKGHSTSIDIALFRARSSAVTTPTTVPAKPTDTVFIPSSTITLGNHLGYNWDETSESVRNVWNGFVGNTIPPLLYTTFAEKFIVDTPSAPPSLRDLKSLEASATFEVAIPNDDLDIIF